MRTKWIIITNICIIVVLLSPCVRGAIQGTAHDLSAAGGTDSCGFCHTPHKSLTETPLWNHKLSNAVYNIYQSTSLTSNVGQPTGSSKLCLSCHDGTVALNATIAGGGGPEGATIAPGAANLGTDLSNDHPVSFTYSVTLSAENAQIRSPSMLPRQLKLDRSNELQCTTCHDPHDNRYGNFLVMSNFRSELCVSCHKLYGWAASSHSSSTASVFSASDQYLQNSEYGTVGDNGCFSCHRVHSAGGRERLLHFANSEDNCLNCHDGSVASTNLNTAISKLSRHGAKQYSGIHDPKESPTSTAQHVDCVDCHNPHAVGKSGSSYTTLVSGAMQGVSGVTASGSITQQIQFEYEVCFKCHGDNPNRIDSTITRQITQTNTRLEFDPSNPSFHPVEALGINQNVPSLKSPWTIASLLSCTDCHNSDSSSGLKGPHGSNYSPLLAYNYETSDFTEESSFAYELCYQCHSRNSILNDESFDKHKKHIVGERGHTGGGVPCSVCHDAHGISSAQGTTLNNSHLINFDRSVVASDPTTGRLEFVDKGVFKGECYLICHGQKHSPKDY